MAQGLDLGQFLQTRSYRAQKSEFGWVLHALAIQHRAAKNNKE